MRPCKKTFLLLVGLISVSMNKLDMALEEAVEAVDEQSKKIKQSVKTNIKGDIK